MSTVRDGGLFGTGAYAVPTGAFPVWDETGKRYLPSALKVAVVAGAAAGDITVAAIAEGDVLYEVLQYIGAGVAVTDVADLTSEFAITADHTINNAGGTNTTGSKLVVRWIGRP